MSLSMVECQNVRSESRPGMHSCSGVGEAYRHSTGPFPLAWQEMWMESVEEDLVDTGIHAEMPDRTLAGLQCAVQTEPEGEDSKSQMKISPPENMAKPDVHGDSAHGLKIRSHREQPEEKAERPLKESMGEALCASCSAIDFRAILEAGRQFCCDNKSAQWQDVKVYEICAQWDPACAMCKLLRVNAAEEKGALGFERDQEFEFTIYARSTRRHEMLSREEDVEFCDWVAGRDDETGAESRFRGESLVFFATASPSHSSRPLIWTETHDLSLGFTILENDCNECGRCIPTPRLLHRKVTPYISSELLRHWLHTCVEDHAKCKALIGEYQAKGLPYGLRVIDCLVGRVIPAPLNCQYVALSYVWGRREVIPFDKRPQTISDAMKFTLMVGERYLWVDKYCIEQDSQTEAQKEHKVKQLGAMGETYGGAFATIVAVEGDTEDYGLAGIERRRQPQNIVQTANGYKLLTDWEYDKTPARRLRLVSDPMLGTLLQASGSPNTKQTSWGSRGWTFQEGMLSSRLLYVFDNEIYFECRTHNCREAVTVMQSKSTHWCELPGAIPRSLKGTGRPLLENEIMKLFWSCVKDYFERSLSYDGDTLIAFQGILDLFAQPPRSSGLKPVPSLLGTPLLGYSEFGPAFSTTSPILHGLCWQLKRQRGKTRRRRKNHDGSYLLPSWTWTSWAGLIYPPPLEDRHDCFPVASVKIPTQERITFLHMKAPIFPAKKGGLPIQCDYGDKAEVWWEIDDDYPDCEILREVGRDAWDMAVLLMYNEHGVGEGRGACGILLRWLDERKTKAERIGFGHFDSEDLPDGITTAEKHAFDLY